MTDFVDRLLGRSPLPAIRPLIPTLFEPARLEDTDDMLPLGSFTNTPVVASDSRPIDQADPNPQAPAPAPAIALLPDASGPANLTHVERHRSGRRLEVHHHHTRSAHRKAPPLQVAEIPATAEFPAAPMPPVVIVDPTPSPPDCTIVEDPATQRWDDKSAIDPLTRPVLPSHPVWPMAAWSQDHPQAPDVHISIGRVEITATTTEKRPRPRAESTTGPRLSLEDYLRGRAGEGR